ncbi:sigma-70 RNA polymerase sigma factor region 4 domain-containing protein [Chitinophaga silvisoli]|nr:sigma-70 family RNA polymerase sigma factor [Chitinophaga silvisoli]
MLHQLANLPDSELMARARKLKDEEAAGILLERYSHLLAAVSLPSLNNYDNTPDEFFPSLLKRLFKSLQTQTIPKIGEWMQFFIKSQSNREARNTYYFPTSASSDITRLENKAEKANSNLLQRKELTATMKEAFDDLDASHKEVLKEFYFDQKTFAEIAADREYTMDKIRKMIKRSKQELASLILEKLEYAKINKHTRPVNETPEPVLVIENEPPKKRKKSSTSSLKNAAPRKQKQSDTMVVEEKQEPALVLISAKSAIQEQESQPAGILISVDEGQEAATLRVAVQAEENLQAIKPAPTLVLVSANLETEIENSGNQEQDSNQGYANSRKQGQDIKDLQQGSLF